MFALLDDVIGASMASNVPFKVAFKRVRCSRAGHNFAGAKFIERQLFEKHPKSNDEYVYTVSLMECECGLIFHSSGLNTRHFLATGKVI